jgi:hypothetical protein
VEIERHQQPSERQVLADHHPEFDHLGVAEVLTQLGMEGGIHLPVVGRGPLGPAHGQRLAGLELALGLGRVDLRDGLLVEALTRRRRVTREQSGVAFVQGCHFEPCELLDAGRNDALAVAGPEEGEVALEEVRKQGEGVRLACAVAGRVAHALASFVVRGEPTASGAGREEPRRIC